MSDDAFSQLREQVQATYLATLQQRQMQGDTEGASAMPSMPSVDVSGSKPAWLGDSWRRGLAVVSLVYAAAGLVIVWHGLDRPGTGFNSWGAAFGGVFAILALLVAYFCVAGFGEVKFSIKTTADSAGAGQDDEKLTP